MSTTTITSVKHRRRPTAWRPLAAAVAGGAILVTTGFGVWASLNATAFNTSPQAISSGTLALTMAANGNGFSQAITNMAPGDVVNRYVDLTNSGNLDAQGLTLGIVATGSSALITDGTTPATTKALKVSVNSCSGSWAPTTGVCTGSTTALLPATTLSSFSTAQSLISGAIAKSAVTHLQVSVQLPDQTETTANGATPTTTIQGQTANLTYTFTESQRTATNTNS
jgi:hypothetical protein